MKKTKGTHKALGRGGRARVIEVTVKSKPVRALAAKQRRQEVKGK
jgi:hypothetical protein